VGNENVLILTFYSLGVLVAVSAIFPLSPPLLFSVDHPFIAFIVDDHNKIPLFVSKVNDPTAA
jgi:serine protease inhibitor